MLDPCLRLRRAAAPSATSRSQGAGLLAAQLPTGPFEAPLGALIAPAGGLRTYSLPVKPNTGVWPTRLSAGPST